VTDFTITGRLAQFGRGGIMEDVSNRLMRDFAACLSQRLGEGGRAAAAPEPEAPSGAEVTAGDAPPEAVAAAAPSPSTPPPAATPPAAAPVKGLSLFFSVVWERIKGLFGRRQ
jgi:uncharacterized protein